MGFSERDMVEWLSRTVPRGTGVEVGIGDDAAVVATPGGERLAVASDQTVEAVHFVRGEVTWQAVGRKALARNLSDLAAMGARPWIALASLGVSGDVSEAEVRSIFEGLIECAGEEDTTLVGGDLTRVEGPVTLDVAVVGRFEDCKPMLRSGAEVGDELWVTGALGGSRCGHHFTFRPRWREGIALARSGTVHAAIDISDGLALDLHRLAAASGVEVQLVADQLPLREMPDGTRASVEQALGDGEDFELLLALTPGSGEDLARNADLVGLALTPVGEVRARRKGGAATIVDSTGNVTPLPRAGYEHRFDG